MNGFWTASGAAEQAAIAASSAWNASYFTRRALWAGNRPRRVAASLLALLSAGVAIEALAGLPVADTSTEVARRVPLLLATTGVAYLVSYRPGAAASGDAEGSR